MEMVEVVIRIPKEDYLFIKNMVENGYKPPSSYYYNIAKGTVLPKGHDRLISTSDLDVSKLVDSDIEWVKGICDISRVQSMIDNAPTVIGADKEKE